jgi:acyl-coenzyme A thioesterase PaaI-like protein
MRNPRTVYSHSDVETRLARIPFMQGLSLDVRSFRDGGATARLMPHEHLLDGCSNRIDDGAILGAFDQMGSVAIWSKYGLYFPHATLSLSIGFYGRSTGQAPVRFSARIAAAGAGLCHTVLEAVCDATGKSIAQGRSTFILGTYARGAPEIEGSAGSVFERQPTASCFADDVGMTNSNGQCRIAFQPHLIGSIDPPALHGGAIAAGALQAAKNGLVSKHQVLSSFSIEFIRAALEQETVFTAEVDQSGRRSSALCVRGRQENSSRLIATSSVRFANFSSSPETLP